MLNLSSLKKLQEARAKLHTSQKIAVLTGAGISQESGIPTFRGQGGLWREYRAEDLATPEAYARDPLLVWEWYQMRFHTVLRAEPNSAHYALAELEKTKDLILVSQNVDGLHKRAGSSRILELHGNITLSRCERCLHLDELKENFSLPPFCSRCHARARPNVVWFGEALPQAIFGQAVEAFHNAELALVIGTSAVVEPAASLALLAKEQGAYLIEINPEPTPLSPLVNFSLMTTASQGMQLLLGK